MVAGGREAQRRLPPEGGPPPTRPRRASQPGWHPLTGCEPLSVDFPVMSSLRSSITGYFCCDP